MSAAERLADYLSEADYLAAERSSPTRHEYFQGEVMAMAGGTYAHGYIIDNLVMALNRRLTGRGCRASSANTRLHIPVFPLYTYPDVMIVCGQPVFLDDTADTILNPAVVVEVLSPSTRRYDLGEKALRYRAVDALQQYLTIDSTRIHAILHTRGQRPGEWLLTETTDAAAILKLAAVGIELPLVEAYADLELSASRLHVK